MAKSEPTIEETAIVTIEKMRADMVGTKYKLLNEVFVKAVNSGGKIDLQDPTFQQQKTSLLNSDPDAPENQGRAVISMTGFEKGSKEKIDKLIKKGASKEQFEAIAQETSALRSELTSKLSSDDGIKELMSDLIIHKAAEVIPFQVRVTKKEGMYNPGDTRPTNNMEAAELGSLLTPGITLPSSVVSALMTDIESIPKVVAPIFNKHMIDIFGQQEGGGILTLDKSKLTKEKIEIFNKRVNADLEAIPVREIVANAVVRDAIKKLEKENGYTISEGETQKIFNKLSPALAELDAEYLKQNFEKVSGQIQKEVVAKSTVTAKVLGGIYIREGNLDKIAHKLSDTHLGKSDQMQFGKIKENLHGLDLPQIAEKLTELEVEKAKASRYDVNKLSDHDLAKMRKENPVQFDKIVLGRDNPTKEKPKATIIDEIIKDAIDKLKGENGVKLTVEREEYLCAIEKQGGSNKSL